jgi:predicted permease
MAKPTGWFGQVVRRLLRAPRFTVVAVVTLAAAVGANAAVFGVLNGAVLKPLSHPQPDQLVGLWHSAPGVNIADLNMSPANYFVYREQSTTFQDVAVFRTEQMSVTGAGDAEQVPALLATESLLPIIGTSPAIGRSFSPADAAPKAPATVILGHAFWQRKFGGDVSVVGRNLTVNGTSRAIIGVLPRSFRLLDLDDPAVVVPLQFDRAAIRLGGFNWRGVGRMKPGVTIEQANADVARMLPIVLRAFPAPESFSVKIFEDARIGANLRSFKNDLVGDVGRPLAVLMGCIAIVLVIACANVANLWLVRLEARRRELSLRAALGAGRGRIAWELMTECLLLGGVSGVAGLGIAAFALKALVAAAPIGIPRLRDISLDWTTAIFTIATAAAASLLFGAVPILKYAMARPSAAMRDAGRSLSQSREQHRMRGALVVAQVALALVLLIGSGLMIRTFHAMTQLDPGFKDPANVQTFRVVIPQSVAREPARVIETQRAIRDRLAAIPGVSAAAISDSVPMDGNFGGDPVFAQDRTYRPGELPKVYRFKYTLPGYFDGIGTSMLAGRDVTWREVELYTPVSIVSRSFALEHWGSAQQAIGKRIRSNPNGGWSEIVGVAADVYDDGLSQPPSAVVYWPMIRREGDGSFDVERAATFSVRTPRTGSEALMKDIRQAIAATDANMPIFSTRTLDEYYRRSMARTSFMLILLGVAGGMALLLGVVGLYGVIAYSVSQRTREIGIRMALGAQPNLLMTMFLRDGLRLTLIGVVLGVGGAIAGVRLMSSLLFQVSSVDPVTYALMSILLVITALVATYLPSRRAAALEPSTALRAE